VYVLVEYDGKAFLFFCWLSLLCFFYRLFSYVLLSSVLFLDSLFVPFSASMVFLVTNYWVLQALSSGSIGVFVEGFLYFC